MSERRHANVVHLDEAPTRAQEKGTAFGFKARMLGAPTGARGIGCTWYEVPPGRSAFPAHFHCALEEAIFVLEGEGSLRIGKDTVTIRQGDYVTFPTGPDHAHRLTNTGRQPLRYLCMSTLSAGAEVVGYPDSGKVAAMGVPPGWKFGEPQWLRVLVKGDASVDYYEGEDVG